MAVYGDIEVSLGTSALITAALGNNSDSDGIGQDLFEGLDGSDAGSANGGVDDYDAGFEVYGVNDSLIWLDTV